MPVNRTEVVLILTLVIDSLILGFGNHIHKVMSSPYSPPAQQFLCAMLLMAGVAMTVSSASVLGYDGSDSGEPKVCHPSSDQDEEKDRGHNPGGLIITLNGEPIGSGYSRIESVVLECGKLQSKSSVGPETEGDYHEIH